MQYRMSKFIEIVLFLPSGHFFFDGRGKISKKRKQAAAGYPGGGYFGIKRIGMTVGNPRKLPSKIPSHKTCAP